MGVKGYNIWHFGPWCETLEMGILMLVQHNQHMYCKIHPPKNYKAWDVQSNQYHPPSFVQINFPQ
jgi:hypothetical protein